MAKDMQSLKPPPGYSSWLEYAVATMDTRRLFLAQIRDTSHWGRDVQRWEMENAAKKELERITHGFMVN